MRVSWHGEGEEVSRESQKYDLALEFLPMLRTLGEPEDEFVVHKVCARVPALSQKMGGLNRETLILELDNSPIRFHHGAFALQEGCG